MELVFAVTENFTIAQIMTDLSDLDKGKKKNRLCSTFGVQK